jgi:plasmid replication initiation protein
MQAAQLMTDLPVDSQVDAQADDLDAPLLQYGQSNELIRAAYSMPLYCKRLLLMGLSKLTYSDPDTDTTDDAAFTFTVTAKEWNAVFKSGNDAYKQMRRATIEMNDTKTGALWFRRSAEFQGVRWFSEVAYPVDSQNRGQGYVRLEFHKRVRQELVSLTTGGHYTKVDLQAVCGLESTYSIRLYELTKQFRDTGLLILPVKELRRLFMLEDSYSRFSDLRVKVIQPGIDEINTKIYKRPALAMRMKKRGPTVEQLIFTFPREPK